MTSIDSWVTGTDLPEEVETAQEVLDRLGALASVLPSPIIEIPRENGKPPIQVYPASEVFVIDTRAPGPPLWGPRRGGEGLRAALDWLIAQQGEPVDRGGWRLIVADPMRGGWGLATSPKIPRWEE